MTLPEARKQKPAEYSIVLRQGSRSVMLLRREKLSERVLGHVQGSLLVVCLALKGAWWLSGGSYWSGWGSSLSRRVMKALRVVL